MAHIARATVAEISWLDQEDYSMGMLLAFAPFIAFAIIDRVVGSIDGLMAGAVTSALLLAWGAIHHRAPKILEAGTFLLFFGLAVYAILAKPIWSIMDVRLRVDAGLLAIVVASMALRRPFTLQYARETVDKAAWESPAFLRTNNVITAVWALAFLAMVVADLILIYRPDLPRVGIFITVAALVGALKFTSWYPERVRSSP
jgi:hypothetical protein